MNYFLYLLLFCFFPMYCGSLFQNFFSLQRVSSNLESKHPQENSQTKKFTIFLNRDEGELYIQHKDGDTVKGKIKGKGINFSSCEVPTKITPRSTKSLKVEEIFGFYHFPFGLHMLVAEGSIPVNLNPSHLFTNNVIRMVTKFRLVSLTSTSWEDRVRLLREQKYTENILLSSLYRHQFYFSDSNYNLLKTYQANQRRNDGDKLDGSPFFWNEEAIKPLQNFPKFIKPFCNCYIKNDILSFHNESYSFTLISRRGKERQGPRYIKRGADLTGAVANYVETEQIIEKLDHPQSISSFVQIRGSIPFLWKQIQPWKLKPPVLSENETTDNLLSMKNHFNKICAHYFGFNETGPSTVYCLNLIDRKGSQGSLGSTWLHLFQRLSKAGSYYHHSLPHLAKNLTLDRDEIIHQSFHLKLPTDLTVQMVWFDYHHHMKKSSAELSRLFEKIKPLLASSRGFYSFGRNQNALVRTNCMDCLDRTNVVQTTVSRWALLQQVLSLGGKINCPSSSLKISDEASESKFRSIWAENGDILSLLYAGSNAMKRDVTRTGKRTNQGVVDDAISYAKRYVANNYQDYENQIGIDLLTKDQMSFELFEKRLAERKAREKALTEANKGRTSANVKYSFSLPPLSKADLTKEVKENDLEIDVSPEKRSFEESILIGASAITALFMFL